MHIAVGVVPQHRLVIQVVEHHAPLVSGAVTTGQVPYPVSDERRGNGGAGVMWIVAGNQAAVVTHPVAAIAIPGITALLGTVFGDFEAAIVGMAFQPLLGRPANQWHGHQGLGSGPAILIGKAIRR